MRHDQRTLAKKVHGQIADLRKGAEDAWPAHLPTITFRQESVTQADFEALCAEQAEPFEEADAAFATWKAAIVQRAAALEGAQAFVRGVYALLPGFLGRQSPNLAKWGAKPKKARRRLTSEQKVTAAAKAAATRVARGTMSKKAKSKIHGTVAAPAAAGAESPSTSGD